MDRSRVHVGIFAALVTVAGLASAAAMAGNQKVSVAFNEARHGDMPGRVLEPEDWNTVYLFELMPGANLIKGSMPISIDEYGDSVEDEDAFRIVVPAGYECKKIRVYYRWKAEDGFHFALLRTALVDDASGAAYQDDEIVYSTDPEWGPDADASPVRLFRRVEELNQIPPLDEFPAQGLTLTAGTWGLKPYWAALGYQGSGAEATFYYSFQFVLTPVGAGFDLQARIETLQDDVRSLSGVNRIRRELLQILEASAAASHRPNMGALSSQLRRFTTRVKQLRGNELSNPVANQLLSQSRAILKTLR